MAPNTCSFLSPAFCGGGWRIGWDGDKSLVLPPWMNCMQSLKQVKYFISPFISSHFPSCGLKHESFNVNV